MTIFSTLLQNVRTMPNKICMREGDNEVSYKRLWMQICNMASYLQKQSNSSDKILIMLPNSHKFIVLLFGAMLAKRVPVIADPKLSYDINEIIDENSIRLTALANDIHVKGICVNELEKITDDLFSDIINEDNVDNLVHSIDIMLTDVALILYTSGSVGRPKGVILTHESLFEAFQNYQRTVSITKEDTLMGVTPFYHS